MTATEWAAVADQLGEMALSILSGKPVTITAQRFADPKVLAIMLMSRTLSNFRGVFSLLETGQVVEARILVRCCLENAFWIAGLQADGDGFVKQMGEDDGRSRLARGELVLSAEAKLPDEAEARLREQLREIRKKWGNPKALTPKQVAWSGLLASAYPIYSQLSSDASHTTMTSLRRHIGKSEIEGEALIDVAPSPREAEIIQTWDWACNAMLGACVGVNEILEGTPAGLGLEQLAECYQALTQRAQP